MKLLLDQGIGRECATRLRACGIDAVHVADLGMSSAKDDEIIAKALDLGRVIVTLDADFHSLLAVAKATGPSVVRVRREGQSSELIASLLVGVLASCRQEIAAGALVSVDEVSYRVHLLPVA